MSFLDTESHLFQVWFVLHTGYTNGAGTGHGENSNNNNNNNLYLYSAISTKKPIALNNGYYIQNIKINLDKKERNINIYSNLKYNII